VQFELTPAQLRDRTRFESFVSEHIAPVAADMDAIGAIDASVLKKLGDEGFLGAGVPAEYGGRQFDALSFGLFVEALAAASPSVASLVTVNNMVAAALSRWGSAEQKEAWLPGIASGSGLAAFALSEPGVGSDARSVETRAEPCGDQFSLSGTKSWITGARVAGMFLIIAQCKGAIAAFVLRADQPGVEVQPIRGMLGHRAAMLGHVVLTNVEVDARGLLGNVGTGLVYVAQTALQVGRLGVAFSSLGIAESCRSASVAYANSRNQFHVPIRKHQLIAEIIANMSTDVAAARLVCYRAASLLEAGRPESILATAIAKYHASRVATRVASDALRVHGAIGLAEHHLVHRLFRDAQVMETIEGTSQIQQLLIAHHVFASSHSGRF
jgi:glutaryl-CoA dehydrogenase (non-decarboxylating)